MDSHSKCNLLDSPTRNRMESGIETRVMKVKMPKRQRDFSLNLLLAKNAKLGPSKIITVATRVIISVEKKHEPNSRTQTYWLIINRAPQDTRSQSLRPNNANITSFSCRRWSSKDDVCDIYLAPEANVYCSACRFIEGSFTSSWRHRIHNCGRRIG